MYTCIFNIHTTWYITGRFTGNTKYAFALLGQPAFTGTRKCYKLALSKLTKGQV